MDKIEEWKEHHQPFELNYHQTSGRNFHDNDEVFLPYWENVLEWAELKNFKRGLDIGCGPRSPLMKFKTSSEVHCLDPLLDKYKEFTSEDWWKNVATHAVPAETFQEDLVGLFDLVWSWNVLDHTYEWKLILSNCSKYLKTGGKFVLGVDIGKVPTIGHPGITESEFWVEIDKLFRIEKESRDFSERTVCLILRVL